MKVLHIQKISKSLRQKYILALSIIAVLVILGQVLIQYTLADQENDSRVINVAGRQRMLSQRITKCSLLMEVLTPSTDRQANLEELHQSLTLWGKSHIGLQRGDVTLGLPGNNNHQIVTMFAQIEPNFQAMLQAVDVITVDGTATLRHQEALTSLLLNQAEFLRGMDAIVFQYDTEARQKVAMIKRMETGILIITFLTLLLEVLFIFRPAERQIQKALEEYQISETSLKSLFDMTPTPLIMLSLNELRFVQVNQAAANLLDISEEEITHKCLRDFLDMEHDEDIAWNQIISRESVTGIELPMYFRGDYAMVIAFSTRANYKGIPHLILGLVDITTKYIQSKNLMLLAATDGMTGLMNRRGFMEKLRLALLRVQEGKIEISLAFLDIDGLKKVNDTYGHQEGDWYINTIASLLRNSVR